MTYSIAYGYEDEHAEALKRGLAKMVPGFTARLCSACDGTGERDYSGCTRCGGHGLLQGDGWRAAAPISVVNQVLCAGGGVLVPTTPGRSLYHKRQPERMR